MPYIRGLTAIAIVILVGTVAGLLAAPGQQKPDFSGRWTADPTPARGAVDMGSGWGSPITITQDALKLTVEYTFFTRGDMQPPLRFIYALDGSETRNSVMMGRGVQIQASKTTWGDGKLTIRTVHTFADPASNKPLTTEVTQILSLDAGTLVVETIRPGVLGGPPSTSRTIYRKAPG
jgi:hypothetical protein